MTDCKVPGATYRLQFNRNFGFAQADAQVAYLNELGITHIYSSPLFKARRGSLHGYSVTNPLELSTELGSRRAFDHFIRELQSRDMGLVLDIVPNHMAISGDNPWWMDVLEDGPGSPYAIFFDIDWHPSRKFLQGKVLLPVLGQPFGQVLENQEISLKLSEKGFAFHYYEHRFPVEPKSCRALLTHGLEALEKAIGAGNPAFLGLMGLITLLDYLPPAGVGSVKKLKERQRDKEIFKRRLWLLYQGAPEIKEFLRANLEIFNGRRGDPASFDLLERLLTEQPYRLAHWKTALETINYRRFFSINDLIGIRIEDVRVFDATHSMLIRLAAEGKISGLRVDHIDGLYDPQGYLELLRSRLLADTRDCMYVALEKILARGEEIPEEWPVQGTTGYEFMDLAGGVLVHAGGLEKLKKIFAAQTGIQEDLPDLVYEKKKLIIKSLFGGELLSLGNHLGQLAEEDRYGKDIQLSELTEALCELTVCLPVYRTYIRNFTVPERDRPFLTAALLEVERRNPGFSPEVLDFLRRVVLVQVNPALNKENRERWLNFVMRWQQFTGPIMAKGLEDTALYVYNLLVSLNEVGSEPQAVAVKEFHRFNEARRLKWPHSLNATSTHDNKRSEDVRARLHVLSELPQEWARNLLRWTRLNLVHKSVIEDRPAPDKNDELLIYQTLLGAWPLDKEEMADFLPRVQAFLVKAAREAKVHSSWIAADPAYEEALCAFVARLLEDRPGNQFLAAFRPFQQRLAFWGALNSLSLTLLKLGSPGVPDFYQGTEMWDFSLVDPDNRRPVDFSKRARLLRTLTGARDRNLLPLARELVAHWPDGRIKLHVIQRGLQYRRRHPLLFSQGAYLPLTAAGPRRENLVAFMRQHEEAGALFAVPRFLASLAKTKKVPLGEAEWRETWLSLPAGAPGRWQNLFTGEILQATAAEGASRLPLSRVFAAFPVALLVHEP